MADQNDGKPETTQHTDPAVAELQEKTARFGASFAVASEAFKGEGVDRLVLGARIVIAVIVVYALVAAIWASL